MVLKCNWRLYNPLSGGSSARARFRRTNHNDEASVGTLSEHLNLTTHMESRMRGNVRVPVRRSGTGKPTVARPPGVPSPTQHLPHSRRLRLRQRSPAFVGRQRRQRRAAPLDDMGAGAIVAGRHPLPHPRWPNAPPGRRRAEVVHETPWGRRPTAKALFGSTHSVSSIRPWSRSRPSDGRVPPAAVVRGHSRSLTARRAPVRAVAASEQQSQAAAQVS